MSLNLNGGIGIGMAPGHMSMSMSAFDSASSAAAYANVLSHLHLQLAAAAARTAIPGALVAAGLAIRLPELRLPLPATAAQVMMMIDDDRWCTYATAHRTSSHHAESADRRLLQAPTDQ